MPLSEVNNRSEELQQKMIKAGQAAASSNFFQAVTIIRVTDPKKRAKLASLANNQAYVETAAEFLSQLDRRRVPIA